MPQAVWTGSIAFGLVNIPVALYPAARPKDVRFHLFDPETGRRVRYRRVTDGAESSQDTETPGVEPSVTSMSDGSVIDEGAARRDPTSGPPEATTEERHVSSEYRSLLRGYEVERDRFVMIQPEELERVRPERSRTIEVEDFVRLEQIDPVFFEKSYYVGPRGSLETQNAYRLLHEAMRRSHRVGIGRFVLRTKPHLVAIRPIEDALVLETLFFADEVQPAEISQHGGSGSVNERELRLAEELIESLAVEWLPERYGDEYREELLRLLSSKTPSEPPVEAERSESRAGADVEQLMDALRKSVEAARRSEPKRPRGAG
jgi:DNA end-binding protein Ku